MPSCILLFFFLLFFSSSYISPYLSTSDELDYLNSGSALSVERIDEVIISPDGSFSAGFQTIGVNAFCFAIWFTNSKEFTPVWMANRDQPVNGKSSTLSLQKDGNLVLRDAGRTTVWTTKTASIWPVQLRLSNTGNLMLQTSLNVTLWQSFDFPTDTLLPNQQFTRNLKLISSRSRSNYSSGFYSFFFDNDNIVRLLYSGANISSIYWPNPRRVSWINGRMTYNSSRLAVVDLSGHFQSTDNLEFFASDFGIGPKRRLTMDFDGNLRLYSLDENNRNWTISWQAISQVCNIHGLCGPNSICVYAPQATCTCPDGFKPKDLTDWSQGCEPPFNHSCDPLDSTFVAVPHTEFYGYDFNYPENLSMEECRNICLHLCSCKAFLYMFDGSGRCFPKTALLNGHYSPSFFGSMHMRVPRNWTFYNEKTHLADLSTTKLNCNSTALIELAATYERKQKNNSLKYVLWFVIGMGGVELIFLVTGWWYMYKNKGPSAVEQGYIIAATGYRRYSFAELKKATGNFSEVIGRGGSGIVYRGRLPDNRVAAVKRLEGLHHGEAEFLAEVSTIGRINHLNVIQIWGFCAEGKHKLLVFEYMEHGSLSENLSSNSLDWEKRFEIAVGTAKGLAYLHEECLEWLLHCDVKPQNILLDANYQPKVADFGLSKLRDRGGVDNLSFSRIRGTRGYMAPEWILNLPITSKVDVYSYGIVVLEMVTGKLSFGFNAIEDSRGREYGNLVTWVREVMCATGNGGAGRLEYGNLVTWVREVMCATGNGGAGWLEEIMDPRVDDRYDKVKMELLVTVALQCVEEDKDARPRMTQVVEMLLRHEHETEFLLS